MEIGKSDLTAEEIVAQVIAAEKTARENEKVMILEEFGSAYKLDGSGYLLSAPVKVNGTIDEEMWNTVELSAIEGELDLVKFKADLEKELGPFKIAS